MRVMEAHGITKRFPGVVALNNVDICFELGKTHCIVGENGAGKSTLIKTLTGVQESDEGSIFIQGENTFKAPSLFDNVAYVPQELDLFRQMTVADNLFMPFEKSGIKGGIIDKKTIEKKAVPWLEKFQIKANAGELVKDISVSEQQLLQIARAMVDEDVNILMLDEPTTSLTTKETDRLFEVLSQIKNNGKAIIFISHKLDEVFAIGDEITVLRNGEKVAHADIKDVDIPWVIEQMVGREFDKNVDYHSTAVSEEILLDVRNLTGERFNDISFQLKRGEILGLSGLVGAGRSELMQAIFGVLPVWSGAVSLGGKKWKFGSPSYSVANGLIYLPEERKQQGILPFMGVKENITITLLDRLKNFVFISGKKENSLANDVVEAYSIKISSFSQLIRNLSGGNQQKVIIGRSMYCNPQVLVFDEPTKGIDVGTKSDIYKLMKKHAEESGIGIILISSEMEEILKCSNRVITMYDGSKVGEFDIAQADKSTILNSIMGVS